MRRLLVCVVALAVAAAGCDDGGEGGSGEAGLSVVAGFYPIAEAVTRVGGHHVEVVNLTPPGTEPHDLELTPAQVDDLEDADVVFYVGGGFQPAVEEVAGRRSGRSVDLLAELDLDGGDEPDPHFWLDPRLMVDAAEVIEATLVDLDRGAKVEFEVEGDEYREGLEALDEDLADGLATCARREVVTSHAAFAYLARRYDLEQIAIAGLSPESEPDAARLAELAELVEERGVTTVFAETLASADVAETLAREAQVRTAVLDPIEGLSAEDAADGADYAVVMRRNLDALRAALGCS